ncbi:MAG: 23S rRNA (adenine(2030)-N(6))-methyltransferase RlmJ [Spirochaetes bacterium]|nr:23S rRNA (adenine(2030)-N(6))-methyltransferase RlmJ [Spirochaetota bacterium]MBU0956824.1 23S rRNA (adenine(2030)-N(6))-methyltransferase RlmJ [Spirochaetota bacterium]
MLAYRHAFHAGNHADVLKHLVLLSCLEYLTRKDTPLLYVDTHAGAGAYNLDLGYAAQNREWLGGVQRLAQAAGPAQGAVPATAFDTAPGQALQRYLQNIAAFHTRQSDPASYPGSPSLAAALLRPQDHAVLCELHPTDHQLLADLFRADRRIQVRKADGFQTLKAVLPPPARRALVLCDPSYELTEDYARLTRALTDSLGRFATGCCLVWYPLLERAEAKALPAQLQSLTEQAGRPWLRTELSVRAAETGERGMSGSGMFVINPPYPLHTELETCLPWLQQTLAAENGSCRLSASES